MNQAIPLAERLRPQTLSDLIGQEHLSGKNSVLQKSIQNWVGCSTHTESSSSCAVGGATISGSWIDGFTTLSSLEIDI